MHPAQFIPLTVKQLSMLQFAYRHITAPISEITDHEEKMQLLETRLFAVNKLYEQKVMSRAQWLRRREIIRNELSILYAAL